MISIKNISKSYDGQKKAVDNISLDIRDGEIFGFLGPNGAGKTTTLKLITGILEQDSGSISIGGLDTVKNAVESKFKFAFVPDDPNVFLRLSGREYLNFLADIYRVDEASREQKIKQLAEAFEMTEALGDRIKSYSHGMRQKIVLMGALIHDPEVWILDEPMTGLDPRSAFVLKNMMRAHADKGKSVVFSTHVLEVAEKVCDRLAIIDKGQIAFCGTIDELNSKEGKGSLEELFLRLVSQDDENNAVSGLKLGGE